MRNHNFAQKIWDNFRVRARVPGFFRGAVFSCGLSIPKRNFDWETPLGIKRKCLAKVENDDFGPKSAWEILVRAPNHDFLILDRSAPGAAARPGGCHGARAGVGRTGAAPRALGRSSYYYYSKRSAHSAAPA